MNPVEARVRVLPTIPYPCGEQVATETEPRRRRCVNCAYASQDAYASGRMLCNRQGTCRVSPNNGCEYWKKWKPNRGRPTDVCATDN